MQITAQVFAHQLKPGNAIQGEGTVSVVLDSATNPPAVAGNVVTARLSDGVRVEVGPNQLAELVAQSYVPA